MQGPFHPQCEEHWKQLAETFCYVVQPVMERIKATPQKTEIITLDIGCSRYGTKVQGTGCKQTVSLYLERPMSNLMISPLPLVTLMTIITIPVALDGRSSTL